jgi:hypothetical protein
VILEQEDQEFRRKTFTSRKKRGRAAETIALILTDRREDGLRGVPPDAERETVSKTATRQLGIISARRASRKERTAYHAHSTD